jgi:hypothetical protein
MGGDQREQPLLGKEGVRPAVMIRTAASAPASLSVAQDIAQPHADPGIQDLEHETTTMLKILEPASHRAIHVGNDGRQALPVGAPGFTPNRVFELPPAFRARPSLTRREG